MLSTTSKLQEKKRVSVLTLLRSRLGGEPAGSRCGERRWVMGLPGEEGKQAWGCSGCKLGTEQSRPKTAGANGHTGPRAAASSLF